MFTTCDHAGYSIKGYKSCPTQDGGAFSLTLSLNGKKLGTVENSGRGGPNLYIFHGAEMASLKATAKKVLKKDYIEIEDIFIENLINDWDNNKRFKRLCKTKVLLRCKGDEVGSYRTIKAVFSPAVKAQILKLAKTKWKVEIVEFLNEVVS